MIAAHPWAVILPPGTHGGAGWRAAVGFGSAPVADAIDVADLPDRATAIEVAESIAGGALAWREPGPLGVLRGVAGEAP